jgi:hypothetical protein
MVGDLILDALHDFSSGENDAGPRSLGARSVGKPLASGEFVNPSEWGLDALFDDSPGPAPTVRSAGPPMAPAAAEPPSTFTAPKPPPPASPAAQRARPPTPSAPTEGGPFWRRWFGG